MERGKKKITAVIHPCIIMTSCGGLDTSCLWSLSIPPQLDRWICCTMGRSSTAASTTGCIMGWREISALGPEHLLLLILYRPWCLLSCFLHVFFLVTVAACCAGGFFHPFLKDVISEALPPSLMGQWHVCPGAWWHQLHQTQQELLAASHRSSPSSPSTTKTLLCKPKTHGCVFLSVFRR